MVFPTVSLAAKDGNQSIVSILVLHEPRILEKMINNIGYDKIKDNPVPVDEGVTL